MKKKILLLSTVTIGVMAIGYTFMTSGTEKATSKTESLVSSTKIEAESMDHSTASVELKTNMRKLWEDHVTWTRNVVFNIIDDLPGTDQAVKRLHKNQDDLGNAIKMYYGAEAGKKLADLLHVHVNVAAEVLKTTKTDNLMAYQTEKNKWFANADEISEFLCKANPNWKPAEMKNMMNDHLRLTIDEAVARKKKDYDGDVVAYDKVHNEILEMSDMLTMGIIKQFPEKFKSTGAEMGQK